jgi:cell division inhibitor SepF
MPGAMHRMGVYLGLVEDDEDYANGEYADGDDGYGHGADRDHARDRSHDRGEYSEPRYSRESRSAAPARVNGREWERGYEPEYAAEPAAPTYVEERPMTPTYQITALHPRTYNEARTIGEQFRTNTPVIMNLSEMDDADAKRLVDFAAGLTFGLHGRIERVTAKVFLLSPHNVTVTAADKARIENGFFNQS